MKPLVKEEINNVLNLRQLYAVTTAFLEKKNIRTKFPYHLDAEKVLALYGKESCLSKLFPNLVPRNIFPKEQTKVSIHHCIHLVVNSLEYLCSNILQSQYPKIAWTILEEESFSYPMGDVIRTEVLKIEKRTLNLHWKGTRYSFTI